jgi:hypothetical protein
MKIIKVKEPKFTIDGAIDLVIDTEEFGAIPYTASNDDTTLVSRELYAKALSGEFGTIAEYKVPEISSNVQLEIIRTERDQRLKATDWTQLPDVPLTTKEKWAVYRQALRDITEQPDPFNIIWPTPPN